MLEIFKSGGPLMYVILLLAILGLAVVLDRLFYLIIKESKDMESMKEEIIKLVKEDKVKEAIEICGTHKSSASKVLKGVLKEVYYDDEAEISLLEEKAREIALEELPKIEKNMWLLSMAAQLSPLVGLLGTVTGMIIAFKVISETGTGDPKALASGIAQALITTAAGLIVAVPSVFSYNYLNKKIDMVLNSIEKSSVEIINVLRKSKINNTLPNPVPRFCRAPAPATRRRPPARARAAILVLRFLGELLSELCIIYYL